MAVIGRGIFGGRRPSTHFMVNRARTVSQVAANLSSYVVDTLGNHLTDNAGNRLTVA